MKKEKFNDIEALLSQETRLPQSLSKEEMVKKLKAAERAKTEPSRENVRDFSPGKKSNRPVFRIAASAAAFVVVAAGAFAVFQGTFGSNRPVQTVPATAQQTVADEETIVKQETQGSNEEPTGPSYKVLDLGLGKPALSSFKSEKDLDNYFSNLAAKYKKNKAYSVEEENIIGATMAAMASDGKTAAESSNVPSMSDGTAHATTNTQVSGVDEGDIVKTDSRYIYIADGQYLSIIDGETMKLAVRKKLRSANSKREISISELYVDGNRLVVTGEEREKTDSSNKKTIPYYDICIGTFRKTVGSIAIVYDITDRENPAEIRRVAQDGSVISSRMVGTFLYTATSYYPDLGDEEAEYTPKVNGTNLSCSEVYIEDKDGADAGYIVLSGFDTANAEGTVSKTGVIASGCTTYCSQDTFYVTDLQYDEKKNMESTVINAFSIKDGAVAYKASGAVPGRSSGQYTMDQNKNYFRIFTDGYNTKTDKDFTNLYVLDENLNVIGRLEDIAKDEELKSARFMGDTAYAVTFKNTDPLFAIDLSKPDEPKMLGEVKLPGFSEYLHPISENLLIGIGYDGDDEDADMSTLKISLFDVSNRKKPKELSSKVIKNCSFNVNTYSAKEFVMFDENTFGIPVKREKSKLLKIGDYRYRESCIFKVFTVKENKIVLKKDYDHGVINDGTYIFRGTFIADKVYTLDEHNIRQFGMESGRMENSLIYAEPEETGEADADVKGEGTPTVAVTQAPGVK